jgi:hypothetical protein
VAGHPTVAEACPYRLVNPNDRGVVVPALRVESEGKVILNDVGAVLTKEGELRGATWTT